MNGFIGAFVEAWAEFRVNRARVILSLVGVGVAVLALTGVVGLGNIVTQAYTEQMERSSGRPATIVVGTPYNIETGEQGDGDELAEVVDGIADRYAITYSGRRGSGIDVSVQLPYGTQSAGTTIVEPAYGVMHRMELVEGQWFAELDELRLQPAVIVNEVIYDQLGRPSLATHPTLRVYGERTTDALIVGVTPSSIYENYPQLYVLPEHFELISPALPEGWTVWYQEEFWVPLELADELTNRIRAEVQAAFGDEWQVDVNRNDYQAWAGSDPIAPLRLAVTGIAILVLALGALGLVNISVVTVRQRIREIGIRRAFGASAGRVFVAVMLESVVATVVAGFIGVVLAILVVRNELLLELIAPGLVDNPGFPVEAAVTGMLAATAVGALAGLVPALIAVRVKVIDAIRY